MEMDIDAKVLSKCRTTLRSAAETPAPLQAPIIKQTGGKKGTKSGKISASMNLPSTAIRLTGRKNLDKYVGASFFRFFVVLSSKRLSRSGTTAELFTCRSCARGGDEVATCPAVERIIDNYPVKKMIPVPQFGFGHDLSAQLG